MARSIQIRPPRTAGHEGECNKQCDSSDGAAATGLGFLTAAAAAMAAL